MNAILGFCSLLWEKRTSENTIKQYIDIIDSNCRQLLGIIDNILEISTIDAGQLQLDNIPVNPSEVIQEFYFVYKSSAEINNNKLIPVFEKNTEFTFNVDEVKLKQVISNILGNALKYTSNGTITFGYRIKVDSIYFFVQDTGPGIDKQYHRAIFERFRKLEYDNTQLYGGNGLGLSISKALIELMGGTIDLQSEINKGAMFYFDLPI